MPPRHFVQFLEFAGQGPFPARYFETRAANRLLNDKEVRVFSDALDRNWRVEMSRASAAGDPKCVTDREFFIRNHCAYPPASFVFSVRNTGFLMPFRSRSREHQPSDATGNGALGQIRAGAWCSNMHRDESHPGAYGASRAQRGAQQIGNEFAVVFLPSELAKAAIDERDLSGKRGCAGTVHVFPAN